MAGMYGCFKSRNSENGAMASGSPDVMANQELTEVVEECSGKKKSKFQSFKKFFTRRKRKEPLTYSGEAGLKASQSSDNINRTPENTLTQSEKDKGSGSKLSLGSKALSHDSVFVSDSSEAAEALGTSQDSIHGKVKSLQLQMKQAIHLGSPPSIMCVKSEDVGTMSEDDGLPCSPPELHTLHTVLNPVQRNGSLSMEGTDSDEDQLSCAASSRVVIPLLVVPGDFSQPASPNVCLDNSAAKHKLGLRHKACNMRKPASRLNVKGEEDSVNEGSFNTSIHEQLEGRLEQEDGDVHSDLLGPKKQEGEEELAQAQHYKQSLLGDTQEDKEEEEEQAGQDVSHAQDVSSPPGCNGIEGFLTEEEPPPSPASSQPSSTAPSVDGNRATPEPPAGDKENFRDAPGFACGSGESNIELGAETNITEKGAGESGEEESSFLEEVLSSLKTPLNAYSLHLETGEASGMEEEQRGVAEKEVEEGKEEEMEEAKEEEVMAPERQVPSCQAVESAEEDDQQEEDVNNVEQYTQDSNKEEVQDVRLECCTNKEEKVKEDYDLGSGKKIQQGQEEEQEAETEVSSEGKEEDVQLKEDDEEVQEKNEEEKEETVEVAEEAMEEWEDERMEESQEGEDLQEAVPSSVDDVGQSGTLDLDEGDAHSTPVVEAPPLGPAHSTPVVEALQLGPAHSTPIEEALQLSPNHIPVELCEEAQTTVEMDTTEPVYDAEVEIDQLDVEPRCHNQAGTDMDQVSIEQERLEVGQTENGQTIIAFEQRSVVEFEGDLDTHEEGDKMVASTDTRPLGSQQASSPLQQSASEAGTIEEDSKSTTLTAEEHGPVEPEVTTEEEGVGKQSADAVAITEEESRHATSPSAAEEETVKQPDQSRPRYTVAPAWQRSLSTGSGTKEITPPSSPTLALSSDPNTPTKAEVVCTSRAEVVLSPSRPRSVGAFPAKPQSSSAEETRVKSEGNPENPFGVRLRKTSVLRHYSSEEESTEPTYESQVQPMGSKIAPIQPISVKPLLPKKPEVQGEGGEKLKPTPGHAGSSGSDTPSWISVARQKQRIYKDTSAKKEEPDRKSSLPLYVSSAACREPSKTMEPSGKGSLQETANPAGAVEKECRRARPPLIPVPAQIPKSQIHLCPVTPKPSPQPTSLTHRGLSQPTPAPVSQRGSIHTNSPSFSKSPLPHPSKAPQPQTAPVAAQCTPAQPSATPASTPFLPRTASTPSGANTSRAPGLSGSGQRGLPAPGSLPTALPQDEPPWMALAKKKAKAWSEMPQIVQ